MLKKELDREVIAGLRKSFKVLRPVYPIVKSKRTGKIIDGLHRYEASPITYEKYSVELDMDEKEEILYRLHLNYRRKVTKNERRGQLIKLAEILKKEGVTREEMVSELAKITPFTPRYVRELLPDEYKMVEFTSKVKAELVPPPKPKVYKPKETAEYRVARMHPRISKMDEAVYVALQEKGIPVEFQREFCVQATTPDLYFPEHNLAVYIDGPVHTAREDKDERLRQLLSNRYGLRVVSVSYETFSESEVQRIVDEIKKEIQ